MIKTNSLYLRCFLVLLCSSLSFMAGAQDLEQGDTRALFFEALSKGEVEGMVNDPISKSLQNDLKTDLPVFLKVRVLKKLEKKEGCYRVAAEFKIPGYSFERDGKTYNEFLYEYQMNLCADGQTPVL